MTDYPDRRDIAARFLPALAALPDHGTVLGCDAAILRDALLGGLQFLGFQRA